ncbi:MAG: hypothetical protein IBX44_03925 [Sulfurospirillum sp.]|nr:hypothetical protein [Sulfurospirillum sp.]
MTNEALLVQLDYTPTDSSLTQVDNIKANTSGFDYVMKHIITLQDQLKAHFCFVALSSTKDYLKIKNVASTAQRVDEVNEIIQKWSKKYKINLEKVDGKETYYVLGYES